MKSLKHYCDQAMVHKLFKEEGENMAGSSPPLGGDPNPQDGTEQKDYMKPNKDTEQLIDSLQQIINIAKTGLERAKDYQDSQNSEKDTDEKDNRDDLVSRPGSDGVGDMFGKNNEV